VVYLYPNTGSPHDKSPTHQRYSPTVILDPNRIKDRDLSSVVVALGRAKRNRWHRIRIHKSLLWTLSREFSFADGGPFPRTAKALENEVTTANAIPDPDNVSEGLQIDVPPLPSRPMSRGADPKFTQRVPTDSSYADLLSIKAATANPTQAQPAPAKAVLRSGATWWIALSKEEAQRFRQEIPRDVMKKLANEKLIYVGPTTEMVEIGPRADLCTAALSPPAFTANTAFPALSNLNSADAGKLVIFDRFNLEPNGACSHGIVVESVARNILQQYAPQLTNNIERAEVDFFLDVAKSGKTMDSYISTFPIDNVRRALQANASVLEQLHRDPTNPLVVPLFYIQALLSFYLADPATQIVSSSVWFRKDGFELLPRDFDFSGSAMLTAAVSDAPQAVEEDVEEPIVSFYNRKDFRTLLVGAYGSDGKPFGGFSNTGTGVCCIDAGEVSIGQCAVRGTSFATPVVATYLFLARAFWRSSGAPVTPKEAVLRLLLSSNLHPEWVGGGYASAGPPQLPLLLTTARQYLVRKDFSISQYALSSATTLFVKEQGAHFKHQVVLACGGDEEVCGLKVVNGSAFVFRLTKGRWERLQEIEMKLQFADGTTVSTIQQFQSLYEGIYSL
jgi:hypothetical protein